MIVLFVAFVVLLSLVAIIGIGAYLFDYVDIYLPILYVLAVLMVLDGAALLIALGVVLT